MLKKTLMNSLGSKRLELKTTITTISTINITESVFMETLLDMSFCNCQDDSGSDELVVEQGYVAI